MSRIACVGAGMGGLSAAVELAAAGHDVAVYERADAPGGKVATATHEGVAFDTGPSVLTMPEVLDGLFEAAGTTLEEELELVHRDPWFRYLYPDGVELEIFGELDRTLESVERTLGSDAREELDDFLRYAHRIWEAAAPHFIFAPAPTFGSMLDLGVRSLTKIRDIDPMRTMWSAITSRVDDRHLQWLLARYATYVGSDPRQAPATLNCIAWLELGGGSWGVRGGMFELATALEDVAARRGAAFHYETPVERIVVEEGRVRGIETARGREEIDALVCNGTVHHLGEQLLDGADATGPEPSQEASMSAWNGVFRARRRPERRRAPHTVLFPSDYLEEFAAIFDRGALPDEPTIYLCAQEKAHATVGWKDDEPLFAMVNAPALSEHGEPPQTDALDERVASRLEGHDLVDPRDPLVWERHPTELADRFPGSGGAIYGRSSNSRFAAFRRPANRAPDLEGLYLAGGGVHPGGGVPMSLQSGRLAAEALREDDSGGTT